MARALSISLAACLAAPLALAAQATITGALQQRRGDRLFPVSDCVVFAGSAEAGPLVGEYSGPKGRFQLAFPPAARVSVGADCPGYRLISINGRQSPVASFDCSQPGLCADVELILEPLASIEGYVLDSNGMPVENVRIELRRTGDDPRRRRGSGGSDDRGYFRLFHLLPGDYELSTRGVRGLAEGLEWNSEPVRLSLAPGDEITGVQVRLTLSEGVELSGRIQGVPPGTKQVMLMLQPLDGGRPFSRSVQLGEDGSFTLDGAAPGRYEAQVALLDNPRPEGQLTTTYVGPVEVAPGGGEVTLVRREPIRLSGTVEVQWPDRKDLPGVAEGMPLYITLESEDGFRRGGQARPPDYRFEVQGLRPGRYRLRPSGPGGAKTERRIAPDEWEPLETIDLNEGDNLELDLRVRFEIGRLSVLVKPPPGSSAAQAAHFVVGIRRNGITRLFPADQNGRLAIDGFPAGDYEICAWPDISFEAANDPETWSKAGDAVREFRHEEGADMEISLTAAP